ncbi:MAG TPA: hypothetical protein ENO22_12355 [candidate division Zixibacteria bacterium]|nr:hypothetical protein [candidate division Zixibacteria bacterium]
MQPRKDECELEGSAEIHLTWMPLFRIAVMMVFPLAIALLFDSIWIKIICWFVFLGMFKSLVSAWGSCVLALAVGILPMYVFVEWDSAPDWLAYIAATILIIEMIYIHRRLKIIAELRKRHGIFI